MELMHLPISQQVTARPFKVGDMVTVTNPEFVTRVGYPMSFEDAFNYIEANHVRDIEDFIDTKLHKIEAKSDFAVSMLASPTSDKRFHKIMSGLASIYLDSKGHGGKERTIHTISRPELQGKTFEVLSKRVVKTGTYYPPWSQYNGDDWDGGPGGLDPCKTHVVLELKDHTMYWNFKNKWDGCWIESCNVRKAC
jgi:hypothetical protein